MNGALYPQKAFALSGWLLLLAVGAIAVLCVGCSVPSGYVAADRLTYDAIAPEYKLYVSEDPDMSEEQKERRYANVSSWDARIFSEEEGIAPPTGGGSE